MDAAGLPHLSFNVVLPNNTSAHVAFCYMANQTSELTSYALKLVVQHCKDVLALYQARNWHI